MVASSYVDNLNDSEGISVVKGDDGQVSIRNEVGAFLFQA